MRFAKYVFIAAGVWGISVLTPLFFLVDISGRSYAAPADYPHFFYGFVAVALVWQAVFLTIGFAPARFRPLMVFAAFEKAAFIVPTVILHRQNRISSLDASAAIPDGLLMVLFIVAFVKTRPSR